MAATKLSNERKAGQTKKKATAQQNATRKVAERRRSGSKPAVSRSAKQISQGRFPGETPLTGEDRPSNRSGGKQRGYEQSFVRDDFANNRKHPDARRSPLRPGYQNRMAGNQR